MNHENLRRLRDLEDRIDRLEASMAAVEGRIRARLKEEASKFDELQYEQRERDWER